MTRVLMVIACLAALAGAAQAAHAQGGRPATPGTAPGAPPGPPVTPVPPEVIAPDRSHRGNANQPLGPGLAQSNGTVRPPAVDPGMQKTPTEGGAMTIIPPPGTPGGAPGAVAK